MSHSSSSPACIFGACWLREHLCPLLFSCTDWVTMVNELSGILFSLYPTGSSSGWAEDAIAVASTTVWFASVRCVWYLACMLIILPFSLLPASPYPTSHSPSPPKKPWLKLCWRRYPNKLSSTSSWRGFPPESGQLCTIKEPPPQQSTMNLYYNEMIICSFSCRHSLYVLCCACIHTVVIESHFCS